MSKFLIFISIMLLLVYALFIKSLCGVVGVFYKLTNWISKFWAKMYVDLKTQIDKILKKTENLAKVYNN